MSVADALQKVVSARALLARAVSGTTGWSDGLREQFDASRLRPLTEAGAMLEKALCMAEDQLVSAQELLRKE